MEKIMIYSFAALYGFFIVKGSVNTPENIARVNKKHQEYINNTTLIQGKVVSTSNQEFSYSYGGGNNTSNFKFDVARVTYDNDTIKVLVPQQNIYEKGDNFSERCSKLQHKQISFDQLFYKYLRSQDHKFRYEDNGPNQKGHTITDYIVETKNTFMR